MRIRLRCQRLCITPRSRIKFSESINCGHVPRSCCYNTRCMTRLSCWYGGIMPCLHQSCTTVGVLRCLDGTRLNRNDSRTLSHPRECPQPNRSNCRISGSRSITWDIRPTTHGRTRTYGYTTIVIPSIYSNEGIFRIYKLVSVYK